MIRNRRSSATAAIILLLLCSFGTQASGQNRKTENNAVAKALFVHADLSEASRLAQQALRRNPVDRNALFIQMELAALRADEFTKLKSAIDLVSSPGGAADPRIQIALGRISSSAANTAAFQAIAPRLLKAMETKPAYSPRLALALLTAEEDGYQRLTSRNLPRLAGLLTDWTLVGGFGKFSNLAFDQKWAPESDFLQSEKYDGHIAEPFHFDNGIVFAPDYFTESGVLYASGEISVPNEGRYVLKVESRGTMQIALHGSPVLVKDDRFLKGPEVQTVPVTLRAGKNRIFVKALPSASPFRISITPAVPDSSQQIAPGENVPVEEAAYIRCAARYWAGDYVGAEKLFEAQKSRSGPLLLLAAELYANESVDSGSEVPLIQELLQRIPGANAAELILAERTYGSEHYEESLLHLGRALANGSDSPKAQELRYELATHFGWDDERKDAILQRLALHPSCAAISEAEKFYANSLQLKRASELDAHLEHCSSVPSLYWEALSRRGNPQLALSSMFLFSKKHSLDRSVRLKLVRELVDLGQMRQAQQEAKALSNLSPNSAWFRRLSDNPELILDGQPHARRTKQLALFSAYRRNALAELGRAEENQAAAGAEILFDDRVVAIHPNGTADLYYHRLVQLWNKAAITEFGEVTVPRGADLLELRTLKKSGGIVEPELTDNKHSVSMPSLIAGNAVEIEYVQHFENFTQPGTPGELSVVFGAPHAQVQDARYILISPAGREPLFLVAPSSMKASEERTKDVTIRSWHFSDLPPFTPEPAMSTEPDRPQVRILAIDRAFTEELPMRYRNDLIEAAQVTRRIQTEALNLRRPSTRETAEAIYAYAMSAARSTDDDWSDGVTSADETLETGEGSRSALMVALASALRIKTDLLLSTEAGSDAASCLGFSCYRHPLVRLGFTREDGSEESLLLDPVLENLAAGALTPTLQNQRALVIPIHDHGRTFTEVTVHSDRNERSVATGDLVFREDGGLEASIQIQLGSWRSAQVRTALKQIPEAQRQSFFEELTTRIFAGAVNVSGEVVHQDDLGQPFEVRISCRVPHFAQWENNEAEIRQLIPQLSLRSMYAGLPTRKYSLFIDTPLEETTTFTLHLPDSVVSKISPQPAAISTEFGLFRTTLKQLDAHTLQVIRDFDIAIQTVTPERYAEFAAFANQTDQAERQEIVLTHILSAQASTGVFDQH
ncbi:MAG TPA: DUF3858 domain-containing protein [Terriglobales bacterium]